MAVAAYFHHATPGLGPDLERHQCAEWGNKQKEVAAQTMDYLDKGRAENDYPAGAAFSVADVTAFAGLAFAGDAKVDIAEGLSLLTAWRAKGAARPSIAG